MEQNDMSLNFSTDTKYIKNDEQKHRLMACCYDEKEKFKKMAEAYFASESYSDEKYLEMCETIVKTVDRISDSCDCKDSLLMRRTMEPLLRVREQAIVKLKIYGRLLDNIKHDETLVVKEDMQLVYITLFQSQGMNLEKWELQLNSINSHVLARPVYAEEAQAQRVMRQKIQQFNEAYIIVAVPKNKINAHPYLPERRDAYGNVLLYLSANAINQDNIVEFVHQGQRYHFYKGKLIAKTPHCVNKG